MLVAGPVGLPRPRWVRWALVRWWRWGSWVRRGGRAWLGRNRQGELSLKGSLLWESRRLSWAPMLLGPGCRSLVAEPEALQAVLALPCQRSAWPERWMWGRSVRRPGRIALRAHPGRGRSRCSGEWGSWPVSRLPWRVHQVRRLRWAGVLRGERRSRHCWWAPRALLPPATPPRVFPRGARLRSERRGPRRAGLPGSRRGVAARVRQRARSMMSAQRARWQGSSPGQAAGSVPESAS